jgi:hypothetical protein
MNVHVLADRRLLDAETSLALLVERARSLQVFGPTVDFDAPVWDLTDIKVARPSAAKTHRLFFTRIAERESLETCWWSLRRSPAPPASRASTSVSTAVT